MLTTVITPHTPDASCPTHLVVLDPSLMLAVDVFLCVDGHAQERSLFDGVLPTVE